MRNLLRPGRRARPERTRPAAAANPLAMLMGREEVAVASLRGSRLVAGRRVLVTGACGAVGAALCRQLARLAPAGLCLVDRDAAGLGRVFCELSRTLDADALRLAEADVTDRARVDRVIGEARPDLVVHAAGLSALDELEHEPCRAVVSNVLGTRTIVEAAVRHGVQRLVYLSSDKAADPASVYGATKRLGELVLQTAAGGTTCFAAARMGDVLGAPGSVLTGLAHRIARQEAVTVTHPEVARHFMTVAEAAALVLEAAALAEEAETFVLDMGSPVPMVELVHRYAEQLRFREVTIRFCGLGPGEKLAEKAFSDSERRVRTAHPKIWATRPAPLPAGLPRLLDLLADAARQGDDDEVRLLMRRMLPEYRPARRPVPVEDFGPPPAGDVDVKGVR